MDTPQCSASFLSVLLLFLLVSCSLPSLISASSFCNPSDRRALSKIKKSLNIPHYFDSWNPWKLSIDCCSWNYVDCNTAGRVTQLSFYTIHAPFHIPEAIGDLPYLNYLVFKDITNFTGSIPYSITKLHNLEFLEIQNTSLSGPIPEFLGQLKNLNSLFLGYNQLSGPLPASLGNLNRLEVLDVRSNKLTGSIPDSFGGFNNDFEDGFFLFLSHNQLSGKVPKSLNISKVDLSYNKLSDASEWLREDGAARYIDLSHNQLDFDLTKVRFPRSIEVLHMSHNKIHGSIPEQVTEVNVQLLDLSYNRLCGKIPVGGNVQDMGAKAFAHNRCLYGPPLPNKCK